MSGLNDTVQSSPREWHERCSARAGLILLACNVGSLARHTRNSGCIAAQVTTTLAALTIACSLCDAGHACFCRYIALSPEELQEWQDDPEGYARRVGQRVVGS